jgi:hypothetical protein
LSLGTDAPITARLTLAALAAAFLRHLRGRHRERPRHRRRLIGVRGEVNREQEGEDQGLQQRIARPARFARTSSSIIGVLSIS